VTTVSPNNGPSSGGTSVIITGASFTGAGAVHFGTTVASFTFNSATQITATSPAGSFGTVDVTVTTPGGTSAASAADRFSYGSTQTWVSAASGDDTNECLQDAPCLTFAAAFTATVPGGEIDVLDPGDYGPLTITKAITILNGDTGEAGAVVSAISAITIQAGSNDTVNLRGLTLDGGGASNNGILVTSARKVNIQNCVIQGFSNGATPGLAGINISPASSVAVNVVNAALTDNYVGLLIQPSAAASAVVTIDRSRLDDNISAGVQGDGTAGGIVTTVVTGSSLSENGDGAIAVSGPGSATMNLMRDAVTQNTASGVVSNQSEGGTATVTVGSSQISGNATGVQSLGSGALLSYQNNQFTQNGSNGSFTVDAVLE